MIINVAEREECRIAILSDGKLEEIYLERASAGNYVGNIYKGVVTNVEPSIQAAFIDFGMGKNGFLHVSDVHPQYFPNGSDSGESVGRKTPRRNRPPIQRCLRRGQELLVQITKEGIGTKGPTLTTYLSVPGRYMVMLPGMRKAGVSRRIEDDETRRKLRQVLSELELPENMGFIARTAAADRTKRELQSDLRYLSRLWKTVEQRIKRSKAPAELYRESDLVTRTIRDVYTSDIQRILVDDPEVAERARDFLKIFNPKGAETVEVYDGAAPIFHQFKIEDELERLHSRRIPLKSGGSLVIDQTEALVAIDVNSGRFRSEADAEMTAFKINLEAADEIARQLRLRDLGGVVVCDFIDMRLDKHKRAVERRLAENLKAHKERAKVLRMSAFGMIELTRQRQRASLTHSIYDDCAACRGTGIVKTPESVALDVMRIIQLVFTRRDIQEVNVTVSPVVADVLQNRKRAALAAIEQNGRRVNIMTNPNAGPDHVTVTCVDGRGRSMPFNVQDSNGR
ncbi:MAG: Rne/Rng family ribonuclease [Planctomycetota bacterium]|nr:MAG: Rne/Rng family ribonuclease [Planctomycetota bacterium]